MKLKSYQSNSVEAAIRLAKVELGDDAIFMGSRENGPGDQSNALYEVTFAAAVGEARPPGGRAVAPRGNGAKDGGSRGIPRHAWVGLARRAFGSWKQGPLEASPREPVAVAAGGPPSAGSHRHWQEFLPAVNTALTGARESAPPAPSRMDGPVGQGGQARTMTAPTVPAGKKAAADVLPVSSTEPAPLEAQPETDKRLFAVVEQLSGEVSRLRNRLGEKDRETAAAAAGEPGRTGNPEFSSGTELLISQGMCVAAARRLVSEALGDCQRPLSVQSLQLRLEALITRDCRVDATLGRQASPSEPAIAAFVGPAGSGKTSTICKLAIRLGMEAGRPVHFVSLDQLRLAAPEQLRSFAELLDAPHTVVEEYGDTMAAVRRAIADAGVSRPPLLLIDTPGYGPAEWKQAQALAQALRALPGLDTHIVLAATSSEGHLRRSLVAYRVFEPRKLLITKLDECAEAGAIVGETLRCRLPISFFSTGQRIPEDIAAASSERLAHQLLQAF